MCHIVKPKLITLSLHSNHSNTRQGRAGLGGARHGVARSGSVRRAGARSGKVRLSSGAR